MMKYTLTPVPPHLDIDLLIVPAPKVDRPKLPLPSRCPSCTSSKGHFQELQMEPPDWLPSVLSAVCRVAAVLPAVPCVPVAPP